MSIVGRRAITKTAAVVLVVVVLVAVIGTAYYYYSSMSLNKSAVNIAFITSLTGYNTSTGLSLLAGARIALDEINTAGGINGRPINLIVHDDQSNPNQGLAQAQIADAQENVLAITGPGTSDVALALRGYAEQNHVPYITLVSTLAITVPGTQYSFRIAPDVITAGAAVAKFFTDRHPGPTKIAFVYSQQSFSQEEVTGAKWYLSTLKNVTIVYDQSFPIGQPDFTTTVAALKAVNPDAIIGHLFGTGLPIFFKEMQEAGFRADQMAADGELALGQYGPQAVGSWWFAYFTPSLNATIPAVTAFNKKAEAALAACSNCQKTPDYYVYNAYLAMYLITEAAKAAGPTLDRTTFLKSLKATSYHDLIGRTISFDQNGAVASTPFFIVQLTELKPVPGSQGLYTWKDKIGATIQFPAGLIPVYDLAKQCSC